MRKNGILFYLVFCIAVLAGMPSEAYAQSSSQKAVAAVFAELLQEISNCTHGDDVGTIHGNKWLWPKDWSPGYVYDIPLDSIVAVKTHQGDLPRVRFSCTPGACDVVEGGSLETYNLPSASILSSCSNATLEVLTDKMVALFAHAPKPPKGPYYINSDGGAVWVYNTTAKQVMCFVDYDVMTGMAGGFGASGDQRSVIVSAHGRSDAGVVPSQIASVRLKSCHPWTIQNPTGR